VQAEDLQKWQMDIQVLDDNPLYRGKTFRLNFRFSRNYPIEVYILRDCFFMCSVSNLRVVAGAGGHVCHRTWTRNPHTPTHLL
jgi:ubiquitin-protein ligase